MPEGIEVEYYRRTAERALQRPIAAVAASDSWYLKGGLVAEEVRSVLQGESFERADRRGKLLVLVTSAGASLGLRFGMTGRLLVDDVGPIERLEYASGRDEPQWDRFAVTFADGGVLRMQDPRRLGGVEVNPDLNDLGPDLYTITPRQLAVALAGSDAPLKARLMDQRRVAGLGNLLTDEILWRAGLDPRRAAGSLVADEVRRLHSTIRRTVRQLTDRGGSHTGDLQVHRTAGARCPRDGAPLLRFTIGGRTTYACAVHQCAQQGAS